ncbi:RimJ/RimL family protein N-acetyltransferase [Stackebrandtia albiflava]|uniref:RimJ/RimL family protein N-acetyltransferase n=1 Tax=Stackebrandtia albiflava TaxID=406432 RepID=A0A562VCU1_9ACTN|nr:GNAT family protein [Stackebrandtia albiflava]TWJ15682.1 RimJ/RimL family protein N-acetyltransferase [Stackebrandtia albiflava]
MVKLTRVEDAAAYGGGLLTGERVRLRPLHADDLDVFERWWEDPAWMVLQQVMVRPAPVGRARELFTRWSANTTPGSVGFSVTDADGVLVGHVTLYGAELPERAATLAVVVAPDRVGEGLGPDAVRVMLRYGFREMGLNRIELTVWEFNTRAVRAYAKCGFVMEGRRRQAVHHDGRFHDQIIMSVLASEWEAARGG